MTHGLGVVRDTLTTLSFDATVAEAGGKPYYYGIFNTFIFVGQWIIRVLDLPYVV